MNRLAVGSALICFLFPPLPAKYVEGQLNDPVQRWTFLARFCFLSMEGRFSYDVEYDIDYAVQKLLLYYDTPNQWPLAYDQTKSCEERESLLKIENNQIINLTSNSRSAECQIIRLDPDKAKYRCVGNRTFRSSRERWWFIAVSNCPSPRVDNYLNASSITSSIIYLC
ncbi:hypothetical protein OUZ56_028373 [Daphnia magna]|uniref:GPR180-like N-terminal domain-containing protein n=1 Tax=Daphnia magna TaxID=35525 RepID=A0ABR0B3Q2_9CRUS|nr:hypothetical protein OUZ56_028373 [Daphnia magna]